MYFERSTKFYGTVSNIMHNVQAPPTGLRNKNIGVRDSSVRTTQAWEVNHIRINDSNDIKNSFFFGQNLGKGNFGVVYRIKEKAGNKEWAMKIINKSKIGTDRFRSIEREIKILKLVKHAHIVYLDRIYESKKRIYLILELCREELGEIFKRKGTFTEDETRYVIAQLASAVAYLHRNLIVHRDLKLENILMAANPLSPNDDLYIKVTDFGLGVILSGVGMDDMLHDICGTLTYIAPEVLSKNYNQQCDVWSMGIIMYKLLRGEFPFYNLDENELMKDICTKDLDLKTLSLSSEGFHLLNKMITKNPTMRIASTEIELHPWILHKTMSRDMLSQNIIDMMKSWKNEMMTNVGDECDWVAFSTSSHGSLETTISTESMLAPRRTNSAELTAELKDIKSTSIKKQSGHTTRNKQTVSGIPSIQHMPNATKTYEKEEPLVLRKTGVNRRPASVKSRQKLPKIKELRN